jgi:hypothetical protein
LKKKNELPQVLAGGKDCKKSALAECKKRIFLIALAQNFKIFSIKG